MSACECKIRCVRSKHVCMCVALLKNMGVGICGGGLVDN